MRQGDVSRRRRLGDTPQARYYAARRAVRFARRFNPTRKGGTK
jgi:hypothetical protein